MKTFIANLLAIYQRELQSYFKSPFAYVIAVVFWLIGGLFLIVLLLSPEGIIAQVSASDQLGLGQTYDVPYEFLKIYLNLLGSLSMFVLPMLSMGLYAEERKQGTLELLATSPLTNWVVALGKLLGVVTFYSAMLVPLMGLELIALSASDPVFPLSLFLLGHLGLLLLGASTLALGMFISSLSDSTVLAAVMTFGVVLLLWVVDAIATVLPGPFGLSLSHLSLLTHFTDFTEGVFDTSGLILFLSYSVLGLYLTAQSIDTLRFQRS
ncbi:ABC-2 type transporter superfamily [Synechococcus sp. PCC 7335]|uniref:ABC transporter permease n=1 Tax=Synechococcus sp. (strain ATCC 29403 / PCC 7335) TaxID=91464 RepID=UPI00017EE01D|nr:ABC transporter permease [Synechococcus sp. PCC 7335]EDX87098.1 ABC-2 type transporter superfamily [Synechococcus sp. PCC 7335]